MSIISESEFDDVWGAHVQPSGDLFEFDDVKNLPLHTVWTVVDSEDGHSIAVPGFHIVNKMGYVVTTKLWDDDCLEAYWFENDLEDDEAEEIEQ